MSHAAPRSSPTLPPRKRSLSANTLGWIWVSPWLVGFVAFLALPAAMSLYYSFCDYPLLEPPLYVGLSNYRRMFDDPVFWIVLKNTAIYAATSIPLGTVAALIIAALLNNKVRGVGFFRAAVFLPTVVPLAASAMIWLWILNGELGLLNAIINPILRPLGLLGPAWIGFRGTGDKAWAMPALILMSLWGVGQSVVIYLAALQDVPESLHEAASIDGVGPIRRFYHITLPLISPVILFNVIVAIIGSSQVFGAPYIMTQGGPDRATYFYSMYMFDKAFTYGQMGYASAMAWVQLLIVLLLTALTFIVSRKLVFYRSS